MANGVPRFDHILITVLENHADNLIIGASAAPYINSLVTQGALLDPFHAEAHPSEPNYVSMFAGSFYGIKDDNTHWLGGKPNLYTQLNSAGLTFKAYSESLRSVGYLEADSGFHDNGYVQKHAGWTNFQQDASRNPSGNVPGSVHHPFTDFPPSSGYSSLANVVYVIPNVNNDMHDGSIATGDAWMRKNLDPYVQWAKTHNSLFIMTFDEDGPKTTANKIATIMVGANVKQGKYSTDGYSHYSMLAMIQDSFGLGRLPNQGADLKSTGATARTIDNIWTTGGGGNPPPVNVPPVAAFTFTVGSNGSVAFDGSTSSDSDGSIASYAWTFGESSSGSNTATSQKPTHVYAASGTYSVKLTVTDNDGASTSITKSVTVTVTIPNRPPVAAFTATIAANMTTVTVNGTGSSDPDGTISAYAWDFGDSGTATGSTATHTYTTNGTYSIILRVTDNGGLSTSVAHSVSITGIAGTNQPPRALLNVTLAADNQTITYDGSTSTDPDGQVVSWAWSFGDGGTSTTATGTHKYLTSGTYTVTLTVKDDKGAATSASQAVTVTVPVSNPSGSIVSYAWDFGDGVTTNGVTASHKYAAAGTYLIRLTVTDDAGNTAVTSHSVAVNSSGEPEGPSIVGYETLSGLTFTARVNAAPSNTWVALPAQVFMITDFADAGPSGMTTARRGLLGVGGGKSAITIAPNSSTKIGSVPLQGSGSVNPLNLLHFTAPNNVILDGFTLVGTPQGHPFGGVFVEGSVEPTISNLIVSGIRGSNFTEPGDTSAVSAAGCTAPTIHDVEVDGDGVGATGLALVGCANGSMRNIYAHDSQYAKGVAIHRHVGDLTITNLQAVNNPFGVAFQDGFANFTLDRPVLGGNVYDLYLGNGNARNTVTIHDPILLPGKSTITVYLPPEEKGRTNLQTSTDVTVFVNGQDVSATMLQFTSAWSLGATGAYTGRKVNYTFDNGSTTTATPALEPVGPGITGYETLAGVTPTAKIATITGKLALPPSDLVFADFAAHVSGNGSELSTGSGIYTNTVSAILGSGRNASRLIMTPNSTIKSTPSNVSATKLAYLTVSAPCVQIQDISLQGVPTGPGGANSPYVYNGLVVDTVVGFTGSRITTHAIPGSAAVAPWETFGILSLNGSGHVLTDVEADGGNVGAVGFGAQGVTNWTLINGYAHHLPYSAGVSVQTSSGTIVITELLSDHNLVGIDLRGNADGTVVTITNPTITNTTNTHLVIAGTGSCKITITDPVLDTLSSKLLISIPVSYRGGANGQLRSDVTVMKSGVDVTNTLVQWS